MAPFHLFRMPGQSGIIVRLFGRLSVIAAEQLDRELSRLAGLGHPALLVNLSGCTQLDESGVLALLEVAVRLEKEGRHLGLVTGDGVAARVLQEWEVAAVLPIFPSEEAAFASHPAPAPVTWSEARSRTLTHWRQARRALLRDAHPREPLHGLTSLLPLCARAEEVRRHQCAATAPRCRFCPLYYALGGRPADVGCRSLLGPLLDAVETGDRETAAGLLEDGIDTIERMELPEDGYLPGPVGVYGMTHVPAAETTLRGLTPGYKAEALRHDDGSGSIPHLPPVHR